MSATRPVPYRYDTIYATYQITAGNTSSQASAWEDVIEIVAQWRRQRLIAADDTVEIRMTCRRCRRTSQLRSLVTAIGRIGKVCCPHCGQQTFIDRSTYDAELEAYYAARRSAAKEKINRWSGAEVEVLIDLLQSGMAIDDIFDHFKRNYNRTKWAVHNRIRELVRSNAALRDCELRCRTAAMRREFLPWLERYQINEWIPYRDATKQYHIPGDHFPTLIQILYSDNVIDIKRGTDGRIVAIARKARE